MFSRIFLARTACYGHCPVYKLEIYPNGQVNYLGQIFVRVEGFNSWQVNAQTVKKLNDLIEKYDYFNIQENSSLNLMMSTDSPSCITEIIMEDGRKRKIRNDNGCNDWPLKLKAFENRIDQIVNSTRYVKDNEVE
jgi:dissimilatory sulfite reductase (desulfoviridin) alpha/beta subunit